MYNLHGYNTVAAWSSARTASTQYTCRYRRKQLQDMDIAGVKRVERTRLKDIRELIGLVLHIQFSWQKYKSRVKWAGHMVRMKDENISETKKQEGCRKRRRPQLGLFEGRPKKDRGRQMTELTPIKGEREEEQ